MNETDQTDQTDQTDRTEALSYSLSFSSDVVRSSREERYSAKTGIAPEWRQPIFSLVFLVRQVYLVSPVFGSIFFLLHDREKLSN